jgi:hypothetical protein
MPFTCWKNWMPNNRNKGCVLLGVTAFDRLITASGLLLQKSIAGSTVTNLSGFTKGIYLVRHAGKSSKEKTGKWIIL